jgi:hypothetical protein
LQIQERVSHKSHLIHGNHAHIHFVSPRGGQGSPETAAAEPHDSTDPSINGADPNSRPISQRLSVESVKLETNSEMTTPDMHHTKRRKNTSESFVAHSPNGQASGQSSPSGEFNLRHRPIVVKRPFDLQMLEWCTNPFEHNSEQANYLMGLYFTHISSAIYSMYPERRFMRWLQEPDQKKTMDDLTLICTTLALGTVFSTNPEHKQAGLFWSGLSRKACDDVDRRFELHLVQTRLLLSLYYFATNSPNDSWDFCGAAILAGSGLRMNIEIELQDSEEQPFPFGLDVHGYLECRRRTFWACFLIDRFSGFCSGHLSVIHPEEVFLRYPLTEEAFENQEENKNPYFDHLTPPIPNDHGRAGSMSYLVQISSMWGDIMGNIYRTTHKPNIETNDASALQFNSHYTQMTARLEAWRSTLPNYLSYSEQNLDASLERGVLGTFIAMHTLYHTACMKLNRYFRPANLVRNNSQSRLDNRLLSAISHARALLKMADVLEGRKAKWKAMSVEAVGFFVPFTGYAIASAVDITSSKGLMRDLLPLLQSYAGAIGVLEILAQHWQSARHQKMMVMKRVRELENLLADDRAVGVVRGGADAEGYFEMETAIEKTFARESDAVHYVNWEDWRRTTGAVGSA